ncbi:MAG: AraC family transcriptional regulator, partial [Acutalibacter sp.]
HRDPNPSNMILAEDTWGFIDFDLSERNIRIFDPCYAATAILSESFDENKPEKLAQWIGIYKNIMYGYDSVAKLSANEIKAIPYVLLFNQLICCAWLSEQEKYTNIFQVNKKMTTWICVNFDALMLE